MNGDFIMEHESKAIETEAIVITENENRLSLKNVLFSWVPVAISAIPWLICFYMYKHRNQILMSNFFIIIFMAILTVFALIHAVSDTVRFIKSR